MGDVRDDATGETRWLTYGELAAARGISKASATRLAFRRRWRRQAGNDGTARVAVPLSELAAREPQPPDDTPDSRDGVSRIISALEGTIVVLREQVHRERELADEARADLRVEREDRARERRLLTERIVQLEVNLEAAQTKPPPAVWWWRVLRRNSRAGGGGGREGMQENREVDTIR